MTKKRVMMMALSCVLVLGMMVGCGSKKDETTGNETASASETSGDSEMVDDQGFQPPF